MSYSQSGLGPEEVMVISHFYSTENNSFILLDNSFAFIRHHLNIESSLNICKGELEVGVLASKSFTQDFLLKLVWVKMTGADCVL